jgi:hypothetical protein
MTLYSTTTEVGRVSDAANDARVSVGDGDLIVVMLFAAIGLLLAASCVALGFGAEVGQILAVST